MGTNEMGGWTWISHMPLQLGRWPEITAEPSPPAGARGGFDCQLGGAEVKALAAQLTTDH